MYFDAENTVFSPFVKNMRTNDFKVIVPIFSHLEIIILYLCVCVGRENTDSYTFSILIHYLINLLKVYMELYVLRNYAAFLSPTLPVMHSPILSVLSSFT